MGSLFVLTFFSDIKTFYGPMVAHDARINETFGAQFGMLRQDGISGCFHVRDGFGVFR